MSQPLAAERIAASTSDGLSVLGWPVAPASGPAPGIGVVDVVQTVAPWLKHIGSLSGQMKPNTATPATATASTAAVMSSTFRKLRSRVTSRRASAAAAWRAATMRSRSNSVRRPARKVGWRA